MAPQFGVEPLLLLEIPLHVEQVERGKNLGTHTHEKIDISNDLIQPFWISFYCNHNYSNGKWLWTRNIYKLLMFVYRHFIIFVLVPSVQQKRRVYDKSRKICTKWRLLFSLIWSKRVGKWKVGCWMLDKNLNRRQCVGWSFVRWPWKYWFFDAYFVRTCSCEFALI